MQSILYQLDCARYYKIRQTIVLILRPSEHAKTSTSKRYILRSTCLKFNLKTVLNSDNHGGSNSKTAALIITLAKSVLSPLAAPLCSVEVTGGRGVPRKGDKRVTGGRDKVTSLMKGQLSHYCSVFKQRSLIEY